MGKGLARLGQEAKHDVIIGFVSPLAIFALNMPICDSFAIYLLRCASFSSGQSNQSRVRGRMTCPLTAKYILRQQINMQNLKKKYTKLKSYKDRKQEKYGNTLTTLGINTIIAIPLE